MTTPPPGLAPRPGGPAVDGCTDWSALNVPALWASLADAGDPRGWQQWATWRRAVEGVAVQRERLTACRAALVRRWPPERSPAAAAFVARIDDLTHSMTEAEAAGTSTMHGLAGLLDALEEAKRRLAPLHREYLRASRDLMPRLLSDDESRLNTQAQAVMYEADARVRQEATRLQPMPTYSATTEIDLPSRTPNGADVVPSARAADHQPGLPPGPALAGQEATFPAAPAGPTAPGGSSGTPTPPSPDGRSVLPSTRPLPGRPPFAGGRPVPGPAAQTPGGPHVPGGPPRPDQPPVRSTNPRESGGAAAAAPRFPVGERHGGARPMAAPGHDGVIRGYQPASPPGNTSAPPAVRTGGQPVLGGAPMAGGPTAPATRTGRPGYRLPDIQWRVRTAGPSVIDSPPEPAPHDPGPGRVIGLP